VSSAENNKVVIGTIFESKAVFKMSRDDPHVWGKKLKTNSRGLPQRQPAWPSLVHSTFSYSIF